MQAIHYDKNGNELARYECVIREYVTVDGLVEGVKISLARPVDVKPEESIQFPVVEDDADIETS